MGKLAAFGNHKKGCCGLGEMAESYYEKPTLIPEMTGKTLAQMACGTKSACVLTDDGDVWTWGANEEKDDGNGVLGLGGDFGDVVHSPQKIEGLADTRIRVLACGYTHSCGIADDGKIWQWGWSNSGVIDPTEVGAEVLFRDVKCGKRMSVAIDCDNRLWTWGLDTDGCLGHEESDAPAIVEGIENVIAVACGDSHVVALVKGKKVGMVEIVAFGSNSNGQLGIGGTESSMGPKTVKIKSINKGDKAVGVACGDSYTYVWTEKGEVFSWGNCDDFRLGFREKRDQMEPRRVTNLKNYPVKMIECGGQCCVALHKDNTKLSTWGGTYCAEINTKKMKKCSMAVCGETHTVVYVGPYLVPKVPFYPIQPEEEVKAIIGADINDDQDQLKEEVGVLKKQFYRMAWAKEYCNLELLVAQNDLDATEHDPLMGAKVRYEFFVMGFHFDYAKESYADRSKWMSKGKMKLMEFKGDFKTQMKESGLIM